MSHRRSPADPRRRAARRRARAAPQADKKAYKAALGFEQMLARPARQGDGRPKRRRSPRARTPSHDAGRADRPRSIGGRRPRPRRSSSTRSMQDVVSTVLEAELLVHLDTQIDSARHLLELVLAQGAAIRERDVDARARPPRRHPDRDGPPRRARAGAHRRCCSAPAPRSASPPPPSRSSACARSSRPGAAQAATRALRRAARPARRDRPRARHQPRADAPGAHVPRPPHAPDRPRARGRATGPPARQRRAGPPRRPVYRALDLQA